MKKQMAAMEQKEDEQAAAMAAMQTQNEQMQARNKQMEVQMATMAAEKKQLVEEKAALESKMQHLQEQQQALDSARAAAVCVAAACLVALAEGAPRGDDARDLRQNGTGDEGEHKRALRGRCWLETSRKTCVSDVL